MSTDVCQWLDWREYHSKPLLKKYFDYVVVPLEVMCEFDDFNAHLPRGQLYLPHSRLVYDGCNNHVLQFLICVSIRLVAFWSQSYHYNVESVQRWGRVYLKLPQTMVDDLQWLKKARLAHQTHGREISWCVL